VTNKTEKCYQSVTRRSGGACCNGVYGSSISAGRSSNYSSHEWKEDGRRAEAGQADLSSKEKSLIDIC